MATSSPINLQLTIPADNTDSACHLLATASGLSKMQIKGAMNKGAVQLQTGKQYSRLRRASYQPRTGERLLLHYDADILNRQPPAVQCLADERRYSVWYKPAGILAQGTQWGDHCALSRLVEKHFKPVRSVFLVHRLDREASGIMLLAHNKQAAGKLSQLFQNNTIEKTYYATVRGQPNPPQGHISSPIEGKAAQTHYQVITVDTDNDTALLQVTIKTGRKHQIRRHLAEIGHPVLGDPRYGRGNKSAAGLQLQAIKLAFNNPFGTGVKRYRLDASHSLELANTSTTD